VIIMREGRIAAELDHQDINPEVLVSHAAGITEATA
jgi:rhamnose transport system ATP-binding protein